MHQIKRTHLYLIILIVSALEFTALGRIRLMGIQPDLLLVSILFFSLSLRPERALELGVVAGLLRDLVSNSFFGLNIILFGLTAFLASLNSDKIYKEFFLTQVFLASVATVFLYAGHFFLRALTGNAEFSGFGTGFFWIIAPAALYTSLVAPIIFLVLGRLFRFTRRAA